MSIAKPPLSNVWANAAPATKYGIEDPGGLKDTGWLATSACPPLSWMNWILNKLDAGTRYLLGRGISDYDASEFYNPGDICQKDGVIYTWIYNTGPLNVAPPDVNYWRPWGGNEVATGIAAGAGATVAYGGCIRVAASPYKMLFFRVTLPVGVQGCTITLSGAAAFESGIDVPVATSGYVATGSGDTTVLDVRCRTTGAQTLVVTAAGVRGTDTLDINVMVQGH